MSRRRPRGALIGVTALALCVTVGMTAGVAEAQKKKKKGGKGGTVTVAKTTPTSLPPSTPPQPPGCNPFVPPICTIPGATSLVLVPLTAGKQAKGKTVDFNSVSITYSVTGAARSGTNPASASQVALALTAPNGRTIPMPPAAQVDANATTVGPLTVTTNSPNTACPFVDSSGPTSVCLANSDPDQTVGPPAWTGTLGNPGLGLLGGIPAAGTWTVRARNASTNAPATLSNVSLSIKTTGGKSGKKGKKGKKKK
jgi:hypothetical protein